MKYSRDEIIDRLYLSVIEMDGNEDYLKDIPHEVMGEYALMPRFFYGEPAEDGNYSKSAAVTNELLLNLGMDVDSMIEIASESSKQMFPGQIYDLSADMMGEENQALFDDMSVPKGYAIFNSDHCDGLSVLFYQPEIVDNLASMLEKDVLIFPVDRDVLFAVGVKNNDEIKKLSDSYHESCEKLYGLGEKVLSDKLIHYDRLNRSFDIDGKDFALTGTYNEPDFVSHR